MMQQATRFLWSAQRARSNVVRLAVIGTACRRFRCGTCKQTYTEPHRPRVETHPLGDMRVPMEKAVLTLQLLVEGSSVRTTERITNLHRDTILRLLVHAGEKCEKLMGRLIVNVPVKDVQCDEIWGYVQKKETHKGPEEAHDDSIGEAYCFVAIERHTKLVLNFALGRRSQATTDIFIEGLLAITRKRIFPNISRQGLGGGTKFETEVVEVAIG